MIKVMGQLSLDGKQWDAAIRKAETSAAKMASAVKGHLAAAFSVGAIAAFGNKLIEATDRIGDMAEEMAITTDEVQGLEFVLRRNNSTIEKAALAFNNLEKARQEALKDVGSGAGKAFSFFGVSQSDLITKSRLEIFTQISDRMKDTARTGVELGHSMEIFGTKLAASLRPALEAGFKGAADEARRAKELIESIDLKRIKDAKDELKILETKAITAGGSLAGDIRNNFWEAVLSPEMFLRTRGLRRASVDTQGQVLDEKLKEVNEQNEQRRVEREQLKKVKDDAEAERKKKEDEKAEKERAKLADKGTKKAQEIPSDALTRVGNFLGASGANTILGIQQKQLEFARRSAISGEKLVQLMIQQGYSPNFNLDRYL